MLPIKNYYRISRTTTFEVVTESHKYGFYKTIKGFQELQHLMLSQRRVNTAVTKLLQDFNNYNI